MISGKRKWTYVFRTEIYSIFFLAAVFLFGIRSDAAAPPFTISNIEILTQKEQNRLSLNQGIGKGSLKPPDFQIPSTLLQGISKGNTGGSSILTTKWKGNRDRGSEKSLNRLRRKYKVTRNQGKIILAGSSSIAYWSTARTAFKPLPVVNAGIAGTKVSDWMGMYRRLIVAYHPKAVVLYVGSNDISSSRSSRSGSITAGRVCRLIRSLQKELPDTPIYYISVSPSYVLRNKLKQIKTCNYLVKKFCRGDSNLHFIDCTSYLLRRGKCRRELYRSDGRHFNSFGYKIWKNVVAKRVKRDLL